MAAVHEVDGSVHAAPGPPSTFAMCCPEPARDSTHGSTIIVDDVSARFGWCTNSCSSDATCAQASATLAGCASDTAEPAQPPHFAGPDHREIQVDFSAFGFAEVDKSSETGNSRGDPGQSRWWSLLAQALDLDRDEVCTGPPLPFRQRWPLARLSVVPGKMVNLALVLFMTQAYMVYAPSDPILSNPLGVPEVARENPDRLKRAINQPPEWIPVADSDDRLKIEKMACSYLFLCLALFFVLKFLLTGFAWRRARKPPEEAIRPSWPAKSSFAAWKLYVEQWLRYKSYITRPGTKLYWLQVNALNLFEVTLQFLQLCTYGGFDVYSFDYIPAMDDRIVFLQAVFLCVDLWSISINTFFGLLRCQVISEVVINSLYSFCTILALGGVAHRPSWTVVVNPEAFWQTFFTTAYAFLGARRALEVLDVNILQGLGPEPPLHQESFERRSCCCAQVVIRPLLGLAIVFWAAMASMTDCSILNAQAGWVCPYVTHPLFESPSCNCRALYFLPDPEKPCNVTSLVGISKHATTVQYFGVVGAAGSAGTASYCNLDDALLGRIQPEFFQFTIQVMVMFADEVQAFPDRLEAASKLEKIMWVGGNITRIPRWLTGLSQLTYMAFTLNPVCFETSEFDFWSKFMAEKYDFDPANGTALVEHFACIEHYDIGAVTDLVRKASQSNQTNSSDNATDGICTPDGMEIWQELESVLHRCQDDRNNETACLPGCLLVSSTADPHDVREPFGGLDHQEATVIAPSLGFPTVSLSNLRCVMHMSKCQRHDRLSEEQQLNYIWYSTAALILVKSRCTDCDGFHSMEIPEIP
ncbi:unnamed protein product [Symbiodinium natans]|uniref:Uncharacterized protein n=1 Tax=Symbiodinium natans TaxID=878477 RepID=A0A812I6Q4_9DINO|nr:unnamed protein product [Symbiodinium natans]